MRTDLTKHRWIRMKSPHRLAGMTLTRYEGEPLTIELGAGLSVNIKHGDFANMMAVMSPTFLHENPHFWESIG